MWQLANSLWIPIDMEKIHKRNEKKLDSSKHFCWEIFRPKPQPNANSHTRDVLYCKNFLYLAEFFSLKVGLLQNEAPKHFRKPYIPLQMGEGGAIRYCLLGISVVSKNNMKVYCIIRASLDVLIYFPEVSDPVRANKYCI